MYCMVCERESQGLTPYCERCGFALVDDTSGGIDCCTVCAREASPTEVNFCSECGARLEKKISVAGAERASDWLYAEANDAVNRCVGCSCELEATRRFCRACEAEIAFLMTPVSPVCSTCGAAWQRGADACKACGTWRGEQVASALLNAEAGAERAGRPEQPRHAYKTDRAAGQSQVSNRGETRPMLSSGSPLWSTRSAAASADLPNLRASGSSLSCLGCGIQVDLEGADYCQACSLLMIADDGFQGVPLSKNFAVKGHRP